MSSDDQCDDIAIVTPHHSEYAASEPGASPHRVKQIKLDYQKQKYYIMVP